MRTYDERMDALMDWCEDKMARPATDDEGMRPRSCYWTR